MAGFNPNAPCAVGCEWFPTHTFNVAVAGDLVDANTMEWRVDSLVAETIDAVWVAAQSSARAVSSAKQAMRGGYEVEVYDATALGEAQVTETIYRPTGDKTNLRPLPTLAGYANPPGTFTDTNLYSFVDNDTFTEGTYVNVATDITVQDDTFLSPLFGKAGNAAFRVDSSIGPDHVGQQVLGLRVEALCDQMLALSYTSGAAITPFVVVGGVMYRGDQQVFSGSQPGGFLVSYTWWANPSTGCGWKRSQLSAFAGGSSAFGFSVAANGNANNLPLIYNCNLTVISRPEVRQAVGCLSNPSPGWNRVSLAAPDGADNWSKGEGEYLVTLRRRTGTGQMLVPVIVGEAVHQVQSVFCQYSPLTRAPTGFEFIDDPGTAGLIFETTGGAVSTDSQPYTSATDYYPQLGYFRVSEWWPSLGVQDDWAYVDVQQTVAQELTVGADGDYSFVRFQASLSPFAYAGDPSLQTLYVRLRDAATNTLLASLEFTWDDLRGVLRRDPSSASFGTLEGEFAAQTLTNGQQVLVEFASMAVPNTGWRVMVLGTLDESLSAIINSTTTPLQGGPPTGTEAATFGGTTDTIRVNGDSLAYQHADVAVTLHQVVDAPTGLVAAWEELDCVGFVALSWDAWPADACGIAAEWIVERQDPDGTWAKIATVAGAETSFDDYEAARAGTSSYRLAVRRADMAVSPWSATASVAATTACCGYTFTSNQDPTLTVWYDDLAPRTYRFDEQRAMMRLAGRDGQVVFAETEDRYEAMDVTLLVAAAGGAGGTQVAAVDGRREFDPLLLIAGNKNDPTTGAKVDLPYVCVLDNDGNRWFASVQVTEAVRDETTGSAYTAVVTITEVTKTPAPVLGGIEAS